MVPDGKRFRMANTPPSRSPPSLSHRKDFGFWVSGSSLRVYDGQHVFPWQHYSGNVFNLPHNKEAEETLKEGRWPWERGRSP